MPTPIEITEELAYELTTAQIKYLQTMPIAFEDDGGDYMSAALDLAQMMFDMVGLSSYTKEAWDELLNTPADYSIDQLPSGRIPLWQLATDGICGEVYDLDCPALEEVWDQ
jgi:hypothetical protein